jgi:hypothetical protein
MTLCKISRFIFDGIATKFIKMFPNELISNIQLLGDTRQVGAESCLEALNDVRDCTFKSGQQGPNQFISQMQNAEVDLAKVNVFVGLYLTPQFKEHFDVQGFKCAETLHKYITFQGLMLGFRIDHVDSTGNKSQQKTDLKSLVKYTCIVGFHFWMKMASATRNELNIGMIQKYEPCPFYVRFQRFEDRNPNSSFFLNDFNIAHSHPLNLEIGFVNKKKDVVNQKQTNYIRI